MKTMSAMLLVLLAAPALAAEPDVVREYTLELLTSVSAPIMAMPAYPGLPEGLTPELMQQYGTTPEMLQPPGAGEAAGGE